MVNEREASSNAVDENKIAITDLFTLPALRLPLFVCIVMQLSQTTTGLGAILNYSTEFFIKSGVAESDAPYATLGVGAIMVVMTIVTIPLMDRLGRRPLHLTGLAGMLLGR